MATATKTSLTRVQALSIFNFCGWKSADKWDNDRMAVKLKSVKDVLPEGKPEDEPTAKTLLDVLATIEDGGDFEVTGDGGPTVATSGKSDAEKEAAKKAKEEEAAKKKAEKEAEAAKKKAEKEAAKKAKDEAAAKEREEAEKKHPGGIRPKETAGFYAGLVFKQFGLKNGVTDEMVAKYDELRNKVKPREARAILVWTWHAVNAFLGEFPVEVKPSTSVESAKTETTEKKDESTAAV